ncbi:class I SAM-dependent methyltransferase [Petroclostridium sp. X23]|jgi:SAM-dependent methyltransferase|uniref:class I SAM-dependent DNA methyltransferase n=1 Tax=Petroclostridium sp. X23 TaxID=3045146 RepID=UPI0024AE3BCA|nr:class I SAM-dependent methyltransferase [Petroclostridium sp. X23]WHH61384.1 class I SAM-dependent methyltransferase [Petroclostridium sp. X23]
MTESYSGFAYIYDKLMSDVDYEQWIEYIESIFEKNHIHPKLVLELACGTGNICTRLAQRGYDMIGIDLSEDMLNVAVPKAKEMELDILFLRQDMTQFELYGTVDAILCLMDSVNYILEEEKLIDMFKLVKNYLNPGGLFIFDINSSYKLRETLGNNTFVEDEDEIFYVWENNYDDENEICDFYLNFFIRQGKKYIRVDEVHQQKAYSIAAIEKCLLASGMKLLDVYEPFCFEKPEDDGERVFFIASRKD